MASAPGGIGSLGIVYLYTQGAILSTVLYTRNVPMQQFIRPQQYPEALIAPMREDLQRFGVEEARTAAAVDALLAPGSGSVMIVTNSVCGCAAGRARPAIGLALRHTTRPEKSASVFAGADIDAVARVRELLTGIPPSSPSVALFQ